MGQFGKYERAEDIPEDERRFYYIMDKFRDLSEIEFIEHTINRQWKVVLPKFLAEYHSWWDDWEKECHESMAQLLKPGDHLYDVGAFDGWQSCMFAQIVGGPIHMTLIEPVEEMWSNTKATWERNFKKPPRATFMGFAADRDTPNAKVNLSRWPDGVDYTKIIKAIKFKLLHEHADCTEAMRLDTIRKFVGPPKALHIDVEGAGLIVLRGAEQLLREVHPIVWIALHPEFMRDRFQTSPADLHNYMAELGYVGRLLARDHEEHWVFTS